MLLGNFRRPFKLKLYNLLNAFSASKVIPVITNLNVKPALCGFYVSYLVDAISDDPELIFYNWLSY
jgi:hypothetical protein